MASFFRKLLDQVNPFDGGKTWSNPNPQPQQTNLNNPQVQNQADNQIRQLQQATRSGLIDRNRANTYIRAIGAGQNVHNWQNELSNSMGGGALGSLGTTFGAAIIKNASPQSLIGSAAEYSGRLLNNHGLENFGTRLVTPVRDFSNQAQNIVPNKVAGTIGNVGGNIAAAYLAPAGKLGTIANAARFGTVGAADTSNAIKQAGGSRKMQIIGGGLSGGMQAAAQTLSTGQALGRYNIGKGMIGRLGVAAGTGGADAAAQQLIDNKIAQKTYDPHRSLTENVLPSTLISAGTSGLVRGIHEAATPKTITISKNNQPISNKQSLIEQRQNFQKAYDKETNPTLRKQISKGITDLNQKIVQISKNETGGGQLKGNKDTTSPEILNPLTGQRIPNPDYVPIDRTKLTGKQLGMTNEQLQNIHNMNPNSPEATAKARQNSAPRLNDKISMDLQTTKNQIVSYVTDEILARSKGRNLKQEVMQNGGISSSAYETMPKGIKRNNGMSADKMAQVLGFPDKNTFMDALNSQEKPLTRAEAKQQALDALNSGQHEFSPDFKTATERLASRQAELQTLYPDKKSQITILKNKPTMPSEADFISMLEQAQREGAPVTKNAAQPFITENKRKMAEAVKAGDYETAAKLRADGAELQSKVRTMAEDFKAKQGQKQIPITNDQLPELKSIKDKQVKQDFRNSTNEYLGAKAASRTSADYLTKTLAETHPLTDAQKLEAIQVIDGMKTSSDSAVNAYVDAFRRTTDELYKHYTVDKKLNMGYQSEYLPRNYKNPQTGQAISGQEYDLLMRSSGRMKSREATTLNVDALISHDPNELLSKYVRSMDSVAYGRQYLNNLEQKGLVMTSTDPVRGMKPVVAEGLQSNNGMYWAKPEVADALNKIFGTKPEGGVFEKTLDKTAKASAAIQDIVLSGGLPGRPLNAFTLAQLQKEVTAGHPLQGMKAFVNSWKPETTNKFFNDHINSIKEIQSQGYDVRASVNDTGTMLDKILGANNKFKEAWNQMANDPTFGRFMPVLEVQKYEAFKKSFLKSGLPEAEAQARAVDALKNWTGKRDMFANATASKVGSDAATTLLFAPKYREAMINFWNKNAEAFSPKNINNKAYSDNRRFVVGALGTLVAMNAANVALNGHAMWDNPDGKKDKLLIPIDKTSAGDQRYLGIPTLSSIATVPRNVAMGLYNMATGNFKEAGKNAASFMSIPVRTGADILNNESYFGSKIYDPNSSGIEKATAAGAYIFKNNAHPYVREGLNIAGQGLPDKTKKMLGVQDIPLYQSASQAGELPFRFYDSKYFKGGADGNKASAQGVNITESGTTDMKPADILKASFNSPKGKEMLALKTDAERKDWAAQSTDNREIYRRYKNAEKLYSTPELRPEGLSTEATKTLDKFDRLDTKQKEDYINRTPSAEYDLAKAKYENDVKAGTITTKAEQIRRQNELTKLKVGASTSKEVRDLFSLNKSDLYDFITKDPNGKKYAKEILAYDDALTNAGVQDKNKFRDKYGNESFAPKPKGYAAKKISISKQSGISGYRKNIAVIKTNTKSSKVNGASIVAKSKANIKIKKR